MMTFTRLGYSGGDMHNGGGDEVVMCGEMPALWCW